jgi:hypothetical protein
VYEGEFRFGRREGRGKYKYSKGECYEVSAAGAGAVGVEHGAASMREMRGWLGEVRGLGGGCGGGGGGGGRGGGGGGGGGGGVDRATHMPLVIDVQGRNGTGHAAGE